MIEIGLAHYLAIAAILFTLGIFGIFLNRKNNYEVQLFIFYQMPSPNGL